MRTSERRSAGGRRAKVSPRLLSEAFAEVLGGLPPDRLPAALRACAQCLARAQLLHRVPAVLDALDASLLARHGRHRMLVASAEPLSERAVRHLEEYLAAIVRRPVRARVTVRPALLAGFRAEVGDLVIDASLHGTLARLRQRLRRAGPPFHQRLRRAGPPARLAPPENHGAS